MVLRVTNNPEKGHNPEALGSYLRVTNNPEKGRKPQGTRLVLRVTDNPEKGQNTKVLSCPTHKHPWPTHKQSQSNQQVWEKVVAPRCSLNLSTYASK